MNFTDFSPRNIDVTRKKYIYVAKNRFAENSERLTFAQEDSQKNADNYIYGDEQPYLPSPAGGYEHWAVFPCHSQAIDEEKERKPDVAVFSHA